MLGEGGAKKICIITPTISIHVHSSSLSSDQYVLLKFWFCLPEKFTESLVPPSLACIRISL